MKFRASHVISLLAVIVIVLWFWVNSGKVASDPSPDQSPKSPPSVEQIISGTNSEAEEKNLPQVVVQSVWAEDHPNRFRLYGRTEANREVAVKAKTAGLVKTTPAKVGAYVKHGAVLCRQEVDARQARLDQARANLASAEFDLSSTQTLVDKGYRSEIQLARLKAQLDGARASVRHLR